MKEINEQITNLISMTWMNSPKEPLSKKYLTRFWSIDTQWMSFSDADKLIDELIKKKWIINDNLSFYPNFNIDLENINFGWRPKNSILLELPEMSHKPKQEINKQRIPKTFVTSEESLTSKERRLAKYISAKTGILKDEVIRRAKRKKRSLGQITNSLCLLLIAKEQGMEMNELIEAI